MEGLRRPPSSHRRARTRTLIQLGGLLHKVGIVDLLDIELGGDLQRDPHLKEPVLKLLGALTLLKKDLDHDAYSMDHLREVGHGVFEGGEH